MTCYRVDLPNGVTGIVCVRGKRAAKCFYCRTPHDRLCDYDIGNGKTCSRKLCAQKHAHATPDGRDLCPDHVVSKPLGIDEKPELKIWTGTTYWHRADPDALDVTIMTGGPEGRPFAPSVTIFKPALRAREEVERLRSAAELHEQIDSGKAREIREQAARLELSTWVTYRRQYLAEMLISSGRDVPKEWQHDAAAARTRGVVAHVAAWQAELRRARRVYLCYCPPEKREHCHASLLAAVFTRLGATYSGELERPVKQTNQLALLT